MLYVRFYCLWPDHDYLPALLIFLPIGAICPIVLYLIIRRYPHSILNYLKYVFYLRTITVFDSMGTCTVFRKSPRPGVRSIFLGVSFRCRLMFAGLGGIPPACAVNYIPWAILGFVFQFILRRSRFSFWAKYNCIDIRLF